MTDRWQMKKYRTQATDLLAMWVAIDEQKALWKLDKGLEQQLSNSELAEKSARRVGLEIPSSIDHQMSQA